MGILRSLSRFEAHHRILFYSLVLIATVFLIRILVLVYNPNPVVFGIELHHVDYGALLLLVTVKMLLFGGKKLYNLSLFLAALGTALVIDGYLALRLSVVEPVDAPLEVYNSTIGGVAVIVAASTLALLLIHSLGRKRVLH
jgi:hypothetical protein